MEEYISDHYHYGFRQISEIATKALSPGINDSGTAIKAIDMLSILFIHRLSLKNHGFSPKDSPLLFYKEPDLSMLLYENFTPIRTYGKTDTLVMVNLLEAVNSIIYAARSNTEAIKVIVDYVSALLFDIDKHIKNLLDRNEISKMVERIEECLEDSSKLYDFG